MDRLWIFVKSGIAAALLIPLLWTASLGRYNVAEHWLPGVYFVKERRAEAIPSPKLIIIGGSSALFGLDSHRLQDTFGVPVVNLATHAALSLDFHIDMALRHAKHGDTVLMPLELGYYEQEPDVTSWQATNMQSWGAKYIQWTPETILTYFHHSSFSSLIERILFRRLPLDPPDQIQKYVDQNSQSSIWTWRGYSYKSIDKYGDFMVIKDDPFFTGTAWYTAGTVTSYAISRLQYLQRRLQEMGGRLIITWPVTIKDPRFDLSKKRDHDLVEGIRQKLTGGGLQVICDPEAFQLDRSYFLNTNYHVSGEGGELRTAALASCMLSAGIFASPDKKTSIIAPDHSESD